MLFGLLVILWNVFTRYILHSPHSSTDEISLIILSISIIIGFSINVSEDNNIDMDIVYTMLKNSAVITFFDIFRRVCMCVYSLFIAYYGFQAVALQFATGRTFPITGFPFWISYSIIVFVGIVLTIRCFAALIRTLTQKKNGGAH